MDIRPKTNTNSEYEIRDDVPILDEHVLHDNDGHIIAEITEDKLKRIVRNGNRKIEETGDEIPLIVGHTKDDLPEDQQPEIVGYADKLRVKWLLNTGRKAIFARLKFFKDKAHLISQYPRRSVELWLKKLEIDPISLLGASTPERSLGLLKYSSGDGLHYSHELGNSNMDMAPSGAGNDVVQQVLAAIQQTQEWQQLRQLISQLSGGQEAQGASQGGPQQMEAEDYAGERAGAFHFDSEDFESEDYDSEDYASDGSARSRPASVQQGLATMHPTIAGKSPMRPKFEAEDYGSAGNYGPGTRQPGQEYEAEDYEEEAYAANASRPISAQVGGSPQPSAQGATQTFGPRNNFGTRQSKNILGSGNMISSVPHRSLPLSNSRFSRDGDRIRLARAEREIARSQEVNKHLVLKLRRAERERDLTQLDAEGVHFDRNEEMERGMSMGDKLWESHKTLMRNRYARQPINGTVGSALENSITENAGARTKEQMYEIVNAAQSQNVPYETALDRFTGPANRTF